MDHRAEAKRRYDELKRSITDDKKVRRKARRTRIIGLGVVGAWVILPALLFRVDVESETRSEFFRRPTPHEAYLLDLVSSEPGGASEARAWEAAAFRSIDSPLSVGGGYQEVGIFPDDDPQALGLRVHIPAGQRLRLRMDAQGVVDPPGLFLDLFRAAPAEKVLPPPSAEPRPAFVESGDVSDGSWSFDAPQSGDYVLRLQPELGGAFQYRMTIQVGARWAFPVAGAGEDDIGGVFGDPRDGGARAHHGIDIFKPRGTPVLAAADGPVTSVDTTEIGGRVVWQREADGGHSIYYAHLDKPLVRDGQRLRAGDTVGLVGNTGNARTTPPHLHFGAYRRGAVDPWNLIFPVPPPIPEVRVSADPLGQMGRVHGEGARLRRSPSASGPILVEFAEDVGLPAVRVLAGSGGWYRVLLLDGETGFVHGRHVAFDTLEGTRPVNQQ